jgi:Protein of unknown function (DUF1194)
MISTIAFVMCLGLFAGATDARSQTKQAVDVELILAVDVSGSMTANELRIQRDGYVAALTSQEVIGAIESGRLGKVAIAYFEWAREDRQRVLAPWSLIDGRASAEAFAKKIAAAPLSNMRNTSIAGAIRTGRLALEGNSFEGDRLIIDVSGDGPNNQGGLVTEARDAAIDAGITINGLPIEAEEWTGANLFAPDATLADYYEQCVIGGPLAFVIPVKDWPEFAEAVRRKLVLELSGITPNENARIIPAQAKLKGSQTAPDCLVGERQRRIWQDP